MNVSEVARRLKMNTKELLEKLPELGFDIGKRAIKIDDLLVDKIVMAVEDDRRKKRVASREKQVKEIKLEDNVKTEKKLEKGVIKIPEVIIVKDFADRLNLPVAKVMAELMKNGIMSSLNERIDFETAVIIGEDLGYQVVKLSAEEAEEQAMPGAAVSLKDLLGQETKTGSVTRPPVVIVMGHVDHGKTKLLDAIRQTDVVAGESGGITQHIGAYQVTEKGKKITFLDTPGHEAFKSMRRRGGQVADLAILVVAADEGLKPQTLEVLEIIQKEKLPFIVAINKIDKEGADLERVKKELAEINLIPEDWGGQVICVPVSAKQQKNIPALLDMILLVADMENFKANFQRSAIGTIIESHLDKGEGPVATVLIQSGVLKTGDMVIAGNSAGRVKTMRDFRGGEIKEAGPSTPVRILGLKNIPQVGDILEVTADKKRIKDARLSQPLKPVSQAGNVKAAASQSEEEEAKASLPTLNLLLKTDVLGSQEALLEALAKFADPDVLLKVIKRGLGNITDADVLDAQTANALILAFRVKNAPSADSLARDRQVEILFFDIIYKLLEEVERRLQALLQPRLIRNELGQVLVLAVFKTEKNSMIIGGKVLAGKVKNNTKVKVIRSKETLAVGDLIKLQSGKQEVTEAVSGEQCGLAIKITPIIQENDILEIYEEKIERRQFGLK